MARRFIFNKERGKFDRQKVSAGQVIAKLARYIGVSMLLAALFYVVYASVYSSDREKGLIVENRYLEEEYNLMEERADLLHDAVMSLENRDREIYGEIFGTLPPNFVVHDTIADFGTLFTLDQCALDKQNYASSQELLRYAGHQRAVLDSLDEMLPKMRESVRQIPSILPVNQFSLAQTGASVGMKMNPFYKKLRQHEGIDLLVPVGTDVVATASGRVVEAAHSKQGTGNTIVIDHGNGLRTTYAHLNDIFVGSGQYVRQGDRIGRSGSTGTSFAPHLHYGVQLDGKSVDPVNYFFASLDVHDTRRMLVIATNSGQSLD